MTVSSRSFTFAEAPSTEYVPGYGPYLDNVSMDARYLIADIDVDSNNDGSINKFDDPIETGSAGVSPASIETGSAGVSPAIESGQFGKIALVGDTFAVNLNQITNGERDSTRFGARITGGSGVVTYAQPTLSQKSLTATASTAGQATLVYEIYSLATGAIVSTDSVLITVVDCEASIAVTEEYVYERWEGYDSTDFIISLNQEQVVPVWVNFSLFGDATFDSDYSLAWTDGFEFDPETMIGRVLFSPGETSKSFILTALDDTPDFSSSYSEIDWTSYQEETETVLCSLSAGPFYRLPADYVLDESEDPTYSPETFLLMALNEMEGPANEGEPAGAATAKVVDNYVDLNIDSNNDGTITRADEIIEENSPGKILAVGYQQCQPIELSAYFGEGIDTTKLTFELEYDKSRILLYRADKDSGLPPAVYGKHIDIFTHFLPPLEQNPGQNPGQNQNTLNQEVITLDGSTVTIYVDGFKLGETNITIKAYYQSDSNDKTTREEICRDTIKVNVGFDLDTDSNGDAEISIDNNLLLTQGTNVWIGPSVEDTIEDLPGRAPLLYINAEYANQVNIKTSDLTVPEGYVLQLIVSPGLDVWADSFKTSRLTNCTNAAVFGDDSLGEVYTWSGAIAANDITVYVSASGPLSHYPPERQIHLRLVETSVGSESPSQTSTILARDTIRFQCVNFDIDLWVDSNNNGYLDRLDATVEDLSDFSGFIVPYETEPYYLETDNHYVSPGVIQFEIGYNYQREDWDDKYVRLCQVNEDNQVIQVLAVYSLLNDFSFTDIGGHHFYMKNNLMLVAESSSKNSYEAWIRVDLLSSYSGGTTITANKVKDPATIPESSYPVIPSGSILSSDVIKMTATLFVMERDKTFVKNDAKYAGKSDAELATEQANKWICDLVEGSYQTPQTGGGMLDDAGDSYLRSALQYSDGFMMNFDYEFLRDRSNDITGYLQAQDGRGQNKLSFVANGGVKLGSTGGASAGVFEVALLDMRALVNKALNWIDGINVWRNNISTTDWGKLEECITNEGKLNPLPGNDLFVSEPISRLLNAVGYDRSYSSMYQLPEGSHLIEYIKAAYYASDYIGHISIVQSNLSNNSYGEVSIFLNDFCTYSSFGTNLSKNSSFDNRVYLQAHWGSGVTYSGVNIFFTQYVYIKTFMCRVQTMK